MAFKDLHWDFIQDQVRYVSTQKYPVLNFSFSYDRRLPKWVESIRCWPPRASPSLVKGSKSSLDTYEWLSSTRMMYVISRVHELLVIIIIIVLHWCRNIIMDVITESHSQNSKFSVWLCVSISKNSIVRAPFLCVHGEDIRGFMQHLGWKWPIVTCSSALSPHIHTHTPRSWATFTRWGRSGYPRMRGAGSSPQGLRAPRTVCCILWEWSEWTRRILILVRATGFHFNVVFSLFSFFCVFMIQLCVHFPELLFELGVTFKREVNNCTVTLKCAINRCPLCKRGS